MTTKSFIKYFGQGVWIGLLLFFCAVTFFAFERADARYDSPVTMEDEGGNATTEILASGSPHTLIRALDTLSAAATTIVLVPWNLSYAYQYNYYIKMRKLTGTPNTKIRLEERNAANTTLWYPIDSVSVAGADSVKTHFLLRGTTVYGTFHRLVFVKTGTNTMARNVIFNVKPTN